MWYTGNQAETTLTLSNNCVYRPLRSDMILILRVVRIHAKISSVTPFSTSLSHITLEESSATSSTVPTAVAKLCHRDGVREGLIGQEGVPSNA